MKKIHVNDNSLHILNEYLDKNYMKPLYDFINDMNDNPKDNWYSEDMTYLSNSDTYKDEKNPSKYAFSKPEIVKSKWLVHVGSNLISTQGFTKAFPAKYMKYLYMSGNFSIRDCSEGYSFAFDADDVNDYKVNALYYPESECTQNVTMFIASGIKVQNKLFTKYGQEVIFFNKTAHDFVEIENCCDNREDFKYKWNIMSNDYKLRYKPIYGSDSLADVVKWVKNNYAQYRKSITNKKEYFIKHKNDSLKDVKYGVRYK